MKTGMRGLLGLSLMLGTSGVVAGALAWADPATESVVGSQPVVPYDGYLKIGGAAVSGSQTIRFELYDAATGGTELWEEQQNVDVYDGRFSVGLGSVNNLTNTILDAERVWLSVTIIEQDANGAVVGESTLAGRQAIAPTPFAAWAVNSSDFVVASDMTVASGTGVTGAFTAESGITVNGNIAVMGTATVAGTATSASVSASTDLESSNIVTVRGNATATTLVTTGDTFLGNSTSDDVDFEGALSMNGDLVMNGTSASISGTDIVAGNGSLEITGTGTSSAEGLFIDSNGDADQREALRGSSITLTAGTLSASSAVDASALNVTGAASSISSLSHGLGNCGSWKFLGSTDRRNSRLCVYATDHLGNDTWANYANQCHYGHGGTLCSSNQIRIAMDKNIITSSNVQNYWIADRADDNAGMYVNGYGSGYDFDGERSNSSNTQPGAYCCKIFHNIGY